MAKTYPGLPEGYTQRTVLFLKKACEYFVPDEIDPSKKVAFQQGSYGPWDDRSDFLNELFNEIVPIANNVREAYDILSYWQTIAPEKLETLTSTVPGNLTELVDAYDEAKTKEEKARLAKEYQLRVQRVKEARTPASRKTTEPKKSEVETSETPSEQLKIKIYLKPQSPVVPVELSQEEAKAFKSFRDSANANPQEFVKNLTQRIVKQAQTFSPELFSSIGTAQVEQVATQVALEVAKRFTTGTQTYLNPWVLTPFVNPEDEKIKKIIPDAAKRRELAEAAQQLALIFDNDNKLSRKLLYPVFGEKVTSQLYGPENPIVYVPSEKEDKDSHYEIDPQSVIDTYKKAKPIIEKWYRAFKTKDAKYVYEATQDSINYIFRNSNWYQTSKGLFSRFFSSSFFRAGVSATGAAVGFKTGMAVYSVWASQGIPLLAAPSISVLTSAGSTALTPVITTTYSVLGAGGEVLYTGLATVLPAGEAIGLAGAVTATTAVATKTGISALLASATAALGSFAPIIGTVIGAVAGWIAGKFIEKVAPFLKKHFGRFILVAVIGAGLVLGFPLMVAFGSVMLAGSIIAGTAGVAATGIGFVGFLSGSFHGLLGATLGSWAKYLVIALLGITIYTALAMFIINSGAYIVPPSGNLAQNLGQSEFITVTKEADVSSLTNAQLPKTVNYKITVSAPKGSLSNIQFKNECSVIKEGGSPACAHPTPPETPTVIDANAPFIFSYSQTYDSSFSNSLVTDSFTVTADSPDGKAESSTASASVVIGAPPTKCFDVAGNWPANYKANVLTAIATLTSNYTSYAAKVCGGGNLRIVYDTTKNPGGWGYYGGGTIYLNGGGLSSQIDTLYILAHESGHHLGFAAGPIYYKQYLETVGVAQERPLCSYSNTGNAAEAFAESIALYVTNDQSSQWRNFCSGTYQTKYPKHWNFDKSVLFQ